MLPEAGGSAPEGFPATYPAHARPYAVHPYRWAYGVSDTFLVPRCGTQAMR